MAGSLTAVRVLLQVEAAAATALAQAAANKAVTPNPAEAAARARAAVAPQAAGGKLTPTAQAAVDKAVYSLYGQQAPKPAAPKPAAAAAVKPAATTPVAASRAVTAAAAPGAIGAAVAPAATTPAAGAAGAPGATAAIPAAGTPIPAGEAAEPRRRWPLPLKGLPDTSAVPDPLYACVVLLLLQQALPPPPLSQPLPFSLRLPPGPPPRLLLLLLAPPLRLEQLLPLLLLHPMPLLPQVRLVSADMNSIRAVLRVEQHDVRDCGHSRDHTLQMTAEMRWRSFNLSDVDCTQPL
jgi:hypothetical protein